MASVKSMKTNMKKFNKTLEQIEQSSMNVENDY